MMHDCKEKRIPEQMIRVDCILNHPEFQKAMRLIRILEKERIFCCHGMEHLLDVARIAYITNLEEGLRLKKDVVYAAGLLHDVGKYLQYQHGIPHHVTSAEIGQKILDDAGYEKEEQDKIVQAIFNHRDAKALEGDDLSRILYQADKLSRACYACEASNECNWSEEKKTPGVIA